MAPIPMKRIAAITPNYNQAYLLLPHLEMLLRHADKVLVIQGKAWATKVHEHSAEPDRSPELVAKHFPEVEVIEDRTTDFGADLYNQGLERLEEYDLVTRFDTDMFMTNDDCWRFFAYLRASEGDCYRLDFKTQSVNYYGDLDHGAMDQPELDPMAVNPKHKFDGLLGYPRTCRFLDIPGFIVHHLRHVGKNEKLVGEWLAGGLPYPFTVPAKEIETRYTPEGRWLSAPQEIKDLIEKWRPSAS